MLGRAAEVPVSARDDEGRKVGYGSATKLWAERAAKVQQCWRALATPIVVATPLTRPVSQDAQLSHASHTIE